MKTLLLSAFALLHASCSKSVLSDDRQGTHWNAGESLKIMDGAFQACAGRFGIPEPDGTTTFTGYRISVERAQKTGGWTTLFDKEFLLDEIPEAIGMKDGSEVAQFDAQNNIVTFDLGSQHVQYQIEPNKTEMATPRKPSD